MILGSLVFCAFVVFVGFSYMNEKTKKHSLDNSAEVSKINVKPVGESTESVKPKKINPASDSKIQTLLNSIPDEKSSGEVLSSFHSNINKVGITSYTLDISGCNPDPGIMRFSANKSVMVKNFDKTPHTITHGSGISLEVPAGGEKELTIKNSGVYGYLCDAGSGPNKIAGLFYVVE